MHRYLFLSLLMIITPAYAAHESCSDCHVNAAPQASSAALLSAVPQLCLQCHPSRVAPGEHRIDVAPTNAVPAALPLINGQISCTTCHDAHLATPGKTRLALPQLCVACHPR